MTVFVPQQGDTHSKRDGEGEISSHERAMKRVKIDFRMARMEHRLEWASKCALDGNRRMMEYYLAEAEKDATRLGLHSHASNWALRIRQQFATG